MARIFITGSADGLGHAAAEALLGEGHEVIVHIRNERRRSAVAPIAARGASVVVGDLANLRQTRVLAEQVNALGRMDSILHNAGVYTGPDILAVNLVAPYVLTALIQRPRRLIYLSSGMHRGGRPDLDAIDWKAARLTGSYSDSKLWVTVLAFAIARLWPEVRSHAVDPGWVPTKMGGPGAPDDLRLGHVTQVWLATSDDAQAGPAGGYWFHQQRQTPHPAVHDAELQDRLVDALARYTGVTLP